LFGRVTFGEPVTSLYAIRWGGVERQLEFPHGDNCFSLS